MKNHMMTKLNKIYNNGVIPYITKDEAIKLISSSLAKNDNVDKKVIESFVKKQLEDISHLYNKSLC